MRFFRGRYLPDLISTRFDFYDVDLATNGIWTLITPKIDSVYFLPGICHTTYPLGKVKNEETTQVISRILSDTRKWLLLDCVKPVKVSSCSSLDTTSFPTIIDLELDTLKVLLDATEQVARYHLSEWNETHRHRTFHIEWIDEGEIESVRLTDPLSVFINTILERRAHRASLLRIMRAPGPYDGGADFLFEKYLKVAISLLFDSDRLVLLSCDDYVQDPPMYSSQDRFPLVVAGGGLDIDQVRSEMARILRPTLVHLVHAHRHSQQTTGGTTLPKHCVLYGFHWSRTHLRIFVHFPIKTIGENPADWKFCQAVAAQHWAALEQIKPDQVSTHRNSQDTLFLDRWRMTVALFAIRARVHELEQLLTDINTEEMIPQAQPQPDSAEIDQTLAQFEPRFSSVIQYVHTMRQFWRDRQIEVPQEWIPAGEEVVTVVPTVTRSGALVIVNTLLFSLSKVMLHPLRHLLLPLSKDTMSARRFADSHVGPDFLHSLHVPRSNFSWKILKVDLGENTEPHLARLYDLLTMSTACWVDVSIFLANVFTGFSLYAVRWHPQARYPFEMQTPSTNVVLDFALAVQTVAPTTVLTIKRASQLPLSLSSPAVVLGMRSTTLDCNGSAITNRELNDLKILMAPHLRVVSMAFGGDGNDEYTLLPTWATLFAIFLKAGVVHIIGFTLLRAEGGPVIDACVVDSLPITMIMNDLKDLEDRLRLTIALFTLQTHVVRFSAHWADIVWSDTLLGEERQAILYVTGIPSRRESSSCSDSESRDPRTITQQLGQYRDEDEAERDSNGTNIARDEILVDVIDKVNHWLDGLEADLSLAPELDDLAEV
ncbi:unnamed protein product [Somion occarium]|uniref:Uncharacterized protein n=1 Tax=Somion occarium TaxID=3059160 RepID=A0ABP1DGX0_9APHY